MSANIDYSLGLPAFAMVENSVRPWWAAGDQDISTFPQNADWAVAMEKANLHQSVSKHPLFDRQGNVIVGWNTIERDDTSKTLSVVQSRYTPLQNPEMSFLDNLKDYGCQYETVLGLDEGRITVATLKIGDEFRVIGDDVIKTYLLITNSFDRSTSFRVDKCNTRVVCQNTHVMALGEGNSLFQGKHTENLQVKIKSLSKFFEKIKLQSDLYKNQCQQLVCKTVSDEQIEAFLYDVLGYGKEYADCLALKTNLGQYEEISTRAKNVVKEIENLHQTGQGSDIPGVRGSLWGAFNAVTEYVDHFQNGKSKSIDTKLQSIYFGSGAKLKETAFNKALELSNV